LFSPDGRHTLHVFNFTVYIFKFFSAVTSSFSVPLPMRLSIHRNSVAFVAHDRWGYNLQMQYENMNIGITTGIPSHHVLLFTTVLFSPSCCFYNNIHLLSDQDVIPMSLRMFVEWCL
jgi:hypothetical protein